MKNIYEYGQNSSGGGFDPLGYSVFIEASTWQEADTLAESFGLYFDGVDNGEDCECCGDRWQSARWGDGPDYEIESYKDLMTNKSFIDSVLDVSCLIRPEWFEEANHFTFYLKGDWYSGVRAEQVENLLNRLDV